MIAVKIGKAIDDLIVKIAIVRWTSGNEIVLQVAQIVGPQVVRPPPRILQQHQAQPRTQQIARRNTILWTQPESNRSSQLLLLPTQAGMLSETITPHLDLSPFDQILFDPIPLDPTLLRMNLFALNLLDLNPPEPVQLGLMFLNPTLLGLILLDLTQTSLNLFDLVLLNPNLLEQTSSRSLAQRLDNPHPQLPLRYPLSVR